MKSLHKIERIRRMKKKSKYGRNSKLNPKTHCVKLSKEIVELSREMYVKWEQQKE